jgi:hypothetical protein
MATKVKPKEPYKKNPNRHADRYDKMNEGSSQSGRPSGKPGKKKKFNNGSVQQNLKTGKVQNG